MIKLRSQKLEKDQQMKRLHETLSQTWWNIQSSLFPWLSEELGPLTEKQQELITTLELVRVEEFIFTPRGFPGRPAQDRAAIARAFVAKMIYNLPTTRALLDRLAADKILRRLCGWENKHKVPDEWTFSRAFAEFADSRLAERVHEALIRKNYDGVLAGHISRDSTAIEAREKPAREAVIEAAPVKRGRPKKGEVRVRPQTRIEKQAEGMALADMIADLPTACNVGTKKNSKGYKESWIGYKLHLDVADGGIPVSGLLTSASTHDSQAAIPLMHMSDERIVSLYDLMDAAYDAPQIRKVSVQLGHVPLIDVNPRWNSVLKAEIAAENKRRRLVGHKPAEAIRYHERSTVERVNARLKDEFGGRMVRVRGHAKVMCHLMFGILALTANQLMSLVT